MFPTTKRNVISVMPGPGINDLLIIIDAQMGSQVQYCIRCGGRIKQHEIYVPGYMVPIAIRNFNRLKQVSDHHAGCSDLDYNAHQTLVERYAKILNQGFAEHKIYMEEALHIKIDMQNIRYLREGYTPVLVQGTMISGLSFPEPTRAIITSGNCI
jgi:hypothetical protein